MIRPQVFVYHYKRKENDTGYEDAKELDYAKNISVDKTSGDKKNTFSFDIINHRELTDGIVDYTSKGDFSNKDKIEIYAYNDGEFTGSWSKHLLISGKITSAEYSSERDSSEFSIEGSDATDLMMAVKTPAVYTGDNHTKNTAEMVVDLIQKTNKQSGVDKEEQLKYEYAQLDDETHERIGGGYIWPKLPDGSEFPVKDYLADYSSLNTHLSALSSTEYTGNKSYVFTFYIDKDYNVHFEPAPKVTTFTLDEYKDSPSIVEKGIDTSDMINVVLMNPGRGPSGEGNLIPVYNMMSVMENGATWRYITKKDIGEKTMEYEKKNSHPNNTGFIDNDNFPSEYPWYCAQNAVYKDKEYFYGTKLNNDEEYKEYIKTKIRELGHSHGHSVVHGKNGTPDITIKWEPAYGTNDFEVNQRYNVIMHSIDFEKELVVTDVSHSFDDEWLVTVELAEKEPMK